MKLVAILALGGASALSFSATLWDQSNLVNVPGGGTGAIAGANLSQLVLPENVFGFGAAAGANQVMADDFTVGAGGWNVTGLSFFTYQTGATAPSITGINFAIDPTLAGTTVSAAGAFTVSFTNIYRVANGVTSDANRRIQRVDVTGLNINLAPGTYYLKWNLTGSVASGPWAPPLPTSNAVFGQNVQQSIGGGAFGPAFVDGASIGGDGAFLISGSPVPEPATLSILALGAAGFIARRRKSSK